MICSIHPGAPPPAPQMSKKRKANAADDKGSRGVDLSDGDGGSSKGGLADLAELSEEQLQMLISAAGEEAIRRRATPGAFSSRSQAHRAPSGVCAPQD